MTAYWKSPAQVKLEKVHAQRDRLIAACTDPDLSDEVARDRIDVAARDLVDAYVAYGKALRGSS